MLHEYPIFFDKSGNRWKIMKLSMPLLSIFLIAIFFIVVMQISREAYVPQANQDQAITGQDFPPETRSPSELAYSMGPDTPIIGQGVFLRISRVYKKEGKTYAVDVYTGQAKSVLSDEVLKKVGDHEFVIERYGVSEGRSIVLTFDDGPHPVYTPEILDLLSREGAHSSFFPIGANIIKYPDIVKRMVQEGHDVANHTFGHVDLDLVSGLQARQEINQTQRIIHSVTEFSTSLFRIPYGGNDDASIIDDRRAILEAQHLGYVLASYDIDTNDWGFNASTEISMPELDGSNKVILLHDGGGNRLQTIAFLESFISYAKSEGYTFTSLSRLYKDDVLVEQINPTLSDRVALLATKLIYVWPKTMMHVLFFLSLVIILLSVVVGILLAEFLQIFRKPKRRRNNYYPLVSVVVPAYNEEKVLQKTVRSIMNSRYKNLEVIIVDDGSTDKTWDIVQKLQKAKQIIRGYHQINTGKSAAVNAGIRHARGEIVVSIDADTIFTPATLGKMVRYFYYPYVGAVAGVVKVGNVNGWITRWQALEYITCINIDRASQAFMKSIAIAPGACSAWRRDVVLEAGGFSNVTMAEDCDMTLMVQKLGYEVVQDMGAIAYTESPEKLHDLAKQRFRWLFGTLQAFWKHRDMIFRRKYGWLGMYVIPKSLFGIAMQLLFTPMLVLVAIGNIISGNIVTVGIYAMFGFIIMLITAAAALLLAREKITYLTATPAFRIIYSPLRSILLYVITIAVLGGMETGWNKVVRHNTVNIIK